MIVVFVYSLPKHSLLVFTVLLTSIKISQVVRQANSLLVCKGLKDLDHAPDAITTDFSNSLALFRDKYASSEG